jgi:exodeoxyribonuclease VII large subunit
VIASVGHHTDRTLIDDVAAVCCSTPTHAAEAAVSVDVDAARSALVADTRRLREHGRRAVVVRARTLATLSRAPASHLSRQRARLHQLLRELRAAGRRSTASTATATRTHALALERTARRSAGAEATGRRRELERIALALSAHDPDRTLARGYSLVTDRAGGPLQSAAEAQAAGELTLRFHDGAVPATVAPTTEDPE